MMDIDNTMELRTMSKREDNGRLNYAVDMVDRCEADLKRTLSNGERRDLLKDNTDWDSDFVARCVDWMAGK